MNTPQNNVIRAGPNAPEAQRYENRRQDIGVPGVARMLDFGNVENNQVVENNQNNLMATPVVARPEPIVAAPGRVPPAELMQLQVDTNVVRNLDGLFANSD